MVFLARIMIMMMSLITAIIFAYTLSYENIK